MRPRVEEPLTSWRAVGVLLACLLALLVALWATASHAQPVSPTQRSRAWNQQATSGTDAAVAVTITPTGSERARLYSLSAFCSAGSASVSVTNGGSFSKGWVSSSALFGTASTGVAWTPAPFTGDLGKAVVVTLSTCGGGNVGTLNIQADTYAP